MDKQSEYLTITNSPKNVGRLDELRTFFEIEFGILPSVFVKIPGRVNLIGEHIDYCGYPVLPMAIEQNILLAVARSGDKSLKIRNVNKKYQPYNGNIDDFQINVPTNGGPDWYNYILCGIKGMLRILNEQIDKVGMLMVISGNIPPSSGLSSSSALVCAATLATSYIHNCTLNKQILATVAAESEHFIGTQGGGMDQAIAFLAIKGCAQFIEWDPLTATPIKLPDETIFVIANSLSEANKAATSDFNQRVIECKLGCRIIAEKKGVSLECDTFASLQKQLNCTLIQMEEFINKYLTKQIYTRDDILKELKIDDKEFINEFLKGNTKDIQEFKLRQRALHVIQESMRVLKFRAAAKNGNMYDMAELMRESHTSLQMQYECSHSNLNKLVEISDKMGIKARLTGAGWGGCIVALCSSINNCNEYIDELKSKYFATKSLKGNNINECVFATSPQQGAEIFSDIV